MSDLQHDMHLVDMAFGIAFDDNDPSAEAWQRIRARLTPDRERVAAGLRKKCLLLGLSDEVWLELADAAIDAMGEP